MLRLQSYFKFTVGLFIFSLILAGCGGDAPAENPTANSQNTEPEPTVPFLATDAPTLEPTITSSPALPPPTPVPLDVQLSDLPAGEYSLSMLGTLNSDIGFTALDEGMTGVEYKLAPGGTNLGGPYLVALWTDILTDGTTEDTTAQIVFTIPSSLGAGSHPVVGRDEMASPNDVGVEIITGYETQRFGTSASGTIEIIANGGVGGVFTGEFEVSIADEAGNTTIANGRTSAIGFLPREASELVITGAIELAPPPEGIVASLAREASTAANNDWRLDIAVPSDETNPYVILHRIYMPPNISHGTYEIQPRFSPLDARPENQDATAYVELFNVNDGTRVEAGEISGTLEVLPTRDTFSATFTLTYTMEDGEQVTATGGAFYMFKPAN